MPLSARAQANLDFIALCWIWGSTWLAIKIGLTNVPPATSAAIRFVIAGVLLFGIVLATRAKLPRSAHFSWLVAGQGAQLAINYYLIYWAEQTVPSGLTAVLFAVFPIFTSAIAALIFRIERFGPVNVLGLALGVAGLCIIFWSEVLLAARTSWLGMTAVVLSALVAAFGTTTMKRWGHEFPPLAVNQTVKIAAQNVTVALDGTIVMKPSLLVPVSGDLHRTLRRLTTTGDTTTVSSYIFQRVSDTLDSAAH